MYSARSLTIGGGRAVPVRGVPAEGVCTCQGVYLSGGRLYLARGCTWLGGTWLGATCPGVYLPEGVYLPGGTCWQGGVPVQGVYLPEGGRPRDLSHHAFDVTCMLPPHQLSVSTCAALYIVWPRRMPGYTPLWTEWQTGAKILPERRQHTSSSNIFLFCHWTERA